MQLNPLNSKTGTVVILIDYGTVSQAPDPVQALVDQCVGEISLKSGYNPSEVEFVKKDAILREGCRQAYLKVRGKATAIPFDTYAAQKKGKEYVAPPTQYRTRIKFTRPHSRGFMDKAVVRRD